MTLEEFKGLKDRDIRLFAYTKHSTFTLVILHFNLKHLKRLAENYFRMFLTTKTTRIVMPIFQIFARNMIAPRAYD